MTFSAFATDSSEPTLPKQVLIPDRKNNCEAILPRYARTMGTR